MWSTHLNNDKKERASPTNSHADPSCDLHVTMQLVDAIVLLIESYAACIIIMSHLRVVYKDIIEKIHT